MFSTFFHLDSSVAQVDTIMHNLGLPKVDILIVDTEGADPTPRKVDFSWGNQPCFFRRAGETNGFTWWIGRLI